jgi:type IV secretory pathway VirB10-like protein
MSDASIGSPPPLAPELEDFLRPERERPDVAADAQAAVFARLQSTLGMVGTVAGGAGAASGASQSAAGSGAGGTAAAAGRAGAHLTARALVKTVITLTVGAIVGAGGHAEWERRARRRIVAAPPPVASPAAIPREPPAPPPALPPARADVPEPPGAPAHRPSAAPARPPRNEPHEARRRDVDLAAERTLIEQARTAFARNQGEAALAALGRHLRAFPDGELREERESLMVQVLVGLERYDEARRAGARFRRRFPQSIFGPVVEEALRSIP